MNCFVFYVCVDGVLRGPIPGVGPGSGRPLPLSLKWASCVWALAWALGVRLAATAGARFCYRRALLCACVCRTALSCFINMNARTPYRLPLTRSSG